jgi:hypothetical protein
MLVCFITFAREAAGALAPGFPCALCLLRDKLLAQLGRDPRRENAESHLEFHVIARSEATKQSTLSFAVRWIASLRSQ